MSLRIDSRKNRSSSTTDTNSFFVMPPLAVCLNPPCWPPQQCRYSAWTTGFVRIVPPTQCQGPVNFGLYRGENRAPGRQTRPPSCLSVRKLWFARCPLEKNGAVQVWRSGLELHGRPNLRTETKVHFRALLLRAAASSEADSTGLVIDDDPDLRASVGRLLRSGGMNVQLFATISDFLKSDPPNGPACLVLDVRLPGQSGLDLQRE